jgi:predicted class III extradiol MEMO1 family dioxygenase
VLHTGARERCHWQLQATNALLLLLLLLLQDWMMPLGPAAVDAAAVDWLAAAHGLPINEAPHAAEHSIENQLPFLVHAAAWGWDLSAAGCCAAAAEGAAPAGSFVHTKQQQQQQQRRPVPASLAIVPISVGYLGHQPGLIQQYGAAVAELLQHLRTHGSRQQQECGQQIAAGAAAPAGDSHEVVLIVTSDCTHAGPWYRELPPPGVSLADYMAAQDSPLLQVRRLCKAYGW